MEYMKSFYVYILASKRNGTLYTGVTNDIFRRIEEHKHGNGSAFTAKYDVSKLVWYHEYANIMQAIAVEKRIKHWQRKWKLRLIDSFNYDWRDLSEPVGE
jgi:putative endonuclease